VPSSNNIPERNRPVIGPRSCNSHKTYLTDKLRIANTAAALDRLVNPKVEIAMAARGLLAAFKLTADPLALDQVAQP
jgi:hypothetical protein